MTNPTAESEPSIVTSADPTPEPTPDPVEPVVEPEPEVEEPPLTWDAIEVPEGIELADDVKDEFLAVFNADDLTPAQAAKQLLSLHGRMMESVATEMVSRWEHTQAQWREEVAALPEFRGVNPEQPRAEIARILNRYGSAEARKAFDLTGAGNHPAIVRMLLKIAKDINEEAPVLGGPTTAVTPSRADRLYGNSGG